MTQDKMEFLSKCEDYKDMEEVAKNKNTNPETLEILSHDEDSDVSRTAIERLKSINS